MLKMLVGLMSVFVSTSLLAVQHIDLYQAPLSALKQFSIIQKNQKMARAAGSSSAVVNGLQEVGHTQEHATVITRYQQLYQGLPVVGAQVMSIVENNPQGLAYSQGLVSGHLLEGIQLDVRPGLTASEALNLAKNAWQYVHPAAPVTEESSTLEIREREDKELVLVYLVSFKSVENMGKPFWPFFVIDAHNGTILLQWNNIKNFSDSGPGGNEKTRQYWYGQDELPALDVAQDGAICTMESAAVKLVNLRFSWDWYGVIASPVQYSCGTNIGDPVNGAYSPGNDAYYFGHLIVAMYHEWYGMNVLQHPSGAPMQLVMRVHFGQGYDNAFWDGRSMSFGDGAQFYPLVSADIAAHEVTHGFTEQHANLEYHDQSGSLNESFSDMAAQAARAYFLQKVPHFYNKMYPVPGVITWGIGETIVRDPAEKALRFMDSPSDDGDSADCLDKELAQRYGAECTITYDDVVAKAESLFTDPVRKQNFIVHLGSGVFNKAFYLMAQKLGIRTSYQVMLLANSRYWNPATDFVQGACGVVYAAHDLHIDDALIKAAFGHVGVDTAGCTL